jgi:hypothetical protein
MICVHGSLDRVKDASPEHERQIMPLTSSACALLMRPLTFVPLLGFQRTSDVAGAAVGKGGAPTNMTDQPKLSIPPAHREAHRHPEERDAFHRRYARVRLRRDRSLRPHASASRSRRPHFFPRMGRVFCWALQASRGGHPLSVTLVTSRDEHLCNPLDEESRLEVDDPSVPAGSTGPAVDRG